MVQRFDYHRGLAPLLWAFLALALIEAAGVHLLLMLRWPTIAWPLLALSVASILWLIGWIRSLRRFPHELCGERLSLRLGNLRTVDLALAEVTEVRSSWSGGEQQGKGVLKLSALAYPNCLIALDQPTRLGRRVYDRVAIRLDDPAGFDAAMRARGIAVA